MEIWLDESSSDDGWNPGRREFPLLLDFLTHKQPVHFQRGAGLQQATFSWKRAGVCPPKPDLPWHQNRSHRGFSWSPRLSSRFVPQAKAGRKRHLIPQYVAQCCFIAFPLETWSRICHVCLMVRTRCSSVPLGFSRLKPIFHCSA